MEVDAKQAVDSFTLGGALLLSDFKYGERPTRLQLLEILRCTFL